VRLEGLGKLKNFSDLIGNRTRDLLAYDIGLRRDQWLLSKGRAGREGE
jgi:hypothetical protein